MNSETINRILDWESGESHTVGEYKKAQLELKELEAENKRLEGDNRALNSEARLTRKLSAKVEALQWLNGKQVTRIAELEAALEKHQWISVENLENALLRHGGHANGCARKIHPLNTKCTCGWWDMEKKLKGE